MQHSFLTIYQVLAISFAFQTSVAHPYKRFTNSSVVSQSPQQLALSIADPSQPSKTSTTSLLEQISAISQATTTTIQTLSTINETPALLSQAPVTLPQNQTTVSTLNSTAAPENRIADIITTSTQPSHVTAPTPALTVKASPLSQEQSSEVFQAFERTCTDPASMDDELRCLAASEPDPQVKLSSTSRPLATVDLTTSVMTPESTVYTTRFVTDYITVWTQLEMSGKVTSGPLISFTNGEAIPTASVTSSLLTKSAMTLTSLSQSPTPTLVGITGNATSGPVSNEAVTVLNTATGSVAGSSIDPFRAITSDAPPSQFTSRSDHPVPTANIVTTESATLQTNKFYANLFLGTNEQSVFTLPYTLSWAKNSGGTQSYGMAVQHADSTQRVNGPAQVNIPSQPVSYYANPLNSQQIVLTAAELSGGAEMTVDSLDTFSVNANLLPLSSGTPKKRQQTLSKITFPLVQGMGFTTALYTSLQPEIQTAGAFSNVVSAGSVGSASKFMITLNDGTQWLLYAIPENNATATVFTLSTNSLLQGPANWSGIIQVAKLPEGSSAESLYDTSAGVYATSAKISGAVDGKNAEYTLSWNVTGSNLNNGIMLGFALPHMVESFSPSTNSSVQSSLRLQTPTKGVATAVTSNTWTMAENSLPDDMTFTPWTPASGTQTTYSAAAVNAIYAAAQVELTQDIASQTNTNSMYYAGKAFSKFASILIAVNDICQETSLAQQGLAKLEAAFAQFVGNTQQYPLVYDTVWKGVVSSASYSGGDSGADFGNTYYNDHHFHYGYFLHAAAVIAHLDPNWLNNASNRAWVDVLARDVSNPSSDDAYFPVFRYFDWFQGHSWAHGLFETADGKDQESSSEDVMFSYGLKMWGMVTGDASMEARGNLMLAVQARSLQSYFLLEDDNKNQPADFIGNKVTGIVSISVETCTLFADFIPAIREQGRPHNLLWHQH